MRVKKINELKCIDVTATGEYIGSVMKKMGISDKELSEYLNVSVQAVNKWRHGVSLPDLDNFYKLSQIFGCKINDLLVPAKVLSTLSVKDYVPEIEYFSEADRERKVKRILEYAQLFYSMKNLKKES